MALSASIHKAELNISDLDRHYYQSHNLTVARHPSETEQRMMVRLLAFALNASERLAFTKGLCADDEPEIWLKSLSDEIELWIEVGQPSEERIRKAAGRSRQVRIYSYGDQASEQWWQKLGNACQRFKNVQIFHFPDEEVAVLETFAARQMRLYFTIENGGALVSDGKDSCQITVDSWQNLQ